MIPVRQSTARTVMVGPVLDSSGVAVTTAVVGDFKISKNGGAPAALNASATLTHRHTGNYSLALTTSDVDTVGGAQVTLDKTTDTCPQKDLVVIEEAVYDAYYAASAVGYVANAPVLLANGAHGGAAATLTLLSAVVNNSAGNGVSITGTTEGLYVASTAGDAVHFNSTGGAGLKLQATSGNNVGLDVLGFGSGAGARITGGATGIGAAFVGGATSGNAFMLSTTDGHGLTFSVAGSGKVGINTTIDANLVSAAANTLTASAAATDFVEEIRNSITGYAGALSTDANGRVRVVDGTGAGEINTNAGAIALVDLVSDVTTKSGYSLSAAGVQSIWDSLTAALTTVGSIGKLLVDRIDATVSSRSSHTAANVRTEMDSNSTQLAAIVADTNELQIDWVNGGRLDLLIDAIKAKTDSLTFTSPGKVDSNTREWAGGSVSFGNFPIVQVNDIGEDVINSSNLSSSAVDEIVDAVWNELTLGHTTGGTFGAQLKTIVDSINSAVSVTGVVLNSTGLAASAVEEIRDSITGGAYPLSTDVNGRVRIVDGTGVGELNTNGGNIEQVNAFGASAVSSIASELTTALNGTTYSLPGQVTPSTNPTLAAAIMQIFQRETNPMDQSSSLMQIYNRAGNVVHQKRTVSEAGGTVSLGPVIAGP